MSTTAGRAVSTDSPLRNLPSVDRLLKQLDPQGLPLPTVRAVVRRELAELRAVYQAAGADGARGTAGHDEGNEEKAIDLTVDALHRVRRALHELSQRRIQPVINATGVIIHTNLGRAPLADEAVEAVRQAAAGYTSLEYDLSTGRRGGRAGYLEQNLALLCGAEAATVVNNNAAALVLMLSHFATKPPRQQVIISRGELVQIGGGFRIPEILEASGAELCEVGTTNQTTLDDYRRAIGDRSALILKVHRSNFYMEGFVASPRTDELAAVARAHGLPTVEDLGSGAVFDTTRFAEEREPTPHDVLTQGVDLVCFSGDKLLGGPQAGILAGRSECIEAMKRHPLLRALRCDKLTLSALQATVDLHLRGEGERLPIQAMAGASLDALNRRAKHLAAQLHHLPLEIAIEPSEARIGGGSVPRAVIPSVALELTPAALSARELAQRLTATRPPVVVSIARGRVRLDLRTVMSEQDDALCEVMHAAVVGDASEPTNFTAHDAQTR